MEEWASWFFASSSVRLAGLNALRPGDGAIGCREGVTTSSCPSPPGRAHVLQAMSDCMHGGQGADEGTMDRDDPAYKGQADYTRLVLKLYDPLVLGPIARYVWRCPTSELLARYRQHIRPRHLDVGPGTGYFLVRSGLSDGSDLTIVDPNPNVLQHASRRLSRYRVSAVEADVLKPLPLAGPFDSAALHAVIHCLPGPRERKAVAVSNMAAVLAPDGVFFGASVLGESAKHTRLARAMLRTYNRRGAFDNLEDSEEALHDMLTSSFDEVQMDVIGSLAAFTARRPCRPDRAPIAYGPDATGEGA
jgi:SAM-dependent methyltransferase